MLHLTKTGDPGEDRVRTFNFGGSSTLRPWLGLHGFIGLLAHFNLLMVHV